MMRQKRRASRARGPGQVALWAALRRWHLQRSTTPGQSLRTPAPPSPAAHGWWPRLTPPQVQALLGAGITLALVLWDQVRQRFQQP
jgi:hypothetical protein